MPGQSAQKFFSLGRGLFLGTFFGLNKSRSNSEGSFSVPATGDLSKEWGPSGGPWNVNVNLSSQMIKNLSINMSMSASAGSYYTIRTGKDDNGDLIFNDRPAGIGR